MAPLGLLFTLGPGRALAVWLLALQATATVGAGITQTSRTRGSTDTARGVGFPPASPVSPPPDFSGCHGQDGWRVTFEDRFDGDTLNSSNWRAVDNYTHGSTEKQLYLADEVTVADGMLTLSTRRRMASSGSAMYNFTSGWVEGAGLRFQKYGRFEVRARLPSPGAGRSGFWPTAWPAHWLMPEPSVSKPPNICWPVGGEIDIMEGFRPRGPDNHPNHTSVLMTYHWAQECNNDLYDGGNSRWPVQNDSVTAVDFADEWHTYGVEWQEGRLRWYLDDVAETHRRVAGQPASLFTPPGAMYMILNTAMEPWSRAVEDVGMPLRHDIDRVTWCQRSADPL